MASSGLTDRSDGERSSAGRGVHAPSAAVGRRGRRQRRATRELVVARDFFQGTLDSLAAHIAVLDARGEIIMTNRAWDAFARANDGGAATTIGSSYLAACDGIDEDGCSF